MTDHISAVRQSELHKKINIKINALKHYVQSGDSEFELPKKFSLNWFCGFKDQAKGFQSLSKSSELLKPGAEVRKSIDALLKACEGRQRRPEIEQCELKTKIMELKAELKQVKTVNAGLSQTIIELMTENNALKDKLNNEQRSFVDSHRRVASFREKG